MSALGLNSSIDILLTLLCFFSFLNAARFHVYFKHDLVLSFLEVQCQVGCSRELTLELDIGDESDHNVGLGISPFILVLPIVLSGLGSALGIRV